ncbi:hypothetical protein Aduo_007875 [Ancylostoma duodenale]
MVAFTQNGIGVVQSNEIWLGGGTSNALNQGEATEVYLEVREKWVVKCLYSNEGEKRKEEEEEEEKKKKKKKKKKKNVENTATKKTMSESLWMTMIT